MFYMKVVYDNVVWIDIFYIIMLYMFLWFWKKKCYIFFDELKKRGRRKCEFMKWLTFGCVFDDALIFDCNRPSGGLILYICVVP